MVLSVEPRDEDKKFRCSSLQSMSKIIALLQANRKLVREIKAYLVLIVVKLKEPKEVLGLLEAEELL